MKGLKWLQKILRARRFLTNRRDNCREILIKSELNIKSNQNEFLNLFEHFEMNYKIILGSNGLFPQSVLKLKEKCRKEFSKVNFLLKPQVYDE